MDYLRFGYWDNVSSPESGESYSDVYESHIRTAKKLEALGYDSYFVIEHQNRRSDIVTCPSVYLTAVARETRTLRFGAMMWQLPFHHPLRLAQEIAMLDQLSHGRVEFGTGIGVHEHEFIRWNVPYHKRAQISEEALKIIRMAWTQDEVTFDGEFFKFDEALPSPTPFQKPTPPIWSAGHSDASMIFAARNNLGIAKNIDTDEVVARKFELYRTTWTECGHPGPMPGMFLQRTVHVARTDDKAHEEARRYLATGSARHARSGIAQTRIGWGQNARGMGADSERADNKARGEVLARASEDYEFNIDNGLAIVGSPATVAEKILESQSKIGYTLFTARHQIEGMPPSLVEDSIELFGTEVIPAIRASESVL